MCIHTTNSIANAIIRQGCFLEELDDLKSSDIKVMCQTARIPGGNIFIAGVNPNIVPRLVMPNHGVAVQVILELKLHTTDNTAKY